MELTESNNKIAQKRENVELYNFAGENQRISANCFKHGLNILTNKLFWKNATSIKIILRNYSIL